MTVLQVVRTSFLGPRPRLFPAYLRLSGSGREVGWGGRLFEAGRLLTFSAFKMGAYSRWALIRGCALIRINTVILISKSTLVIA